MKDVKFSISLIVQAANAVLQKDIKLATRIEKGEFNQVFIVETDSERFVMRVFRHGHWPEDGKLLWIENQLTAYSIPHAKVIYYSRSNDYFPHGFMIIEFVQGKNGSDAMVDGDLSFDDFHKKLAVVLSGIHAIPIAKFGLIHSGEGEFSDLVEYKMNKLQKDRQKLSEIPDLDIRFIDRIEEKVREVFSRYSDKLYPVLVHGDATPDNSIVTPDGNIVLVDWDAATADTWICDYAWLTYWGSHMSHLVLERNDNHG